MIYSLFKNLKKKMDFFILLILDPEEVVFLWSIYYLIHIII